MHPNLILKIKLLLHKFSNKSQFQNPYSRLQREILGGFLISFQIFGGFYVWIKNSRISIAGLKKWEKKKRDNQT